MPSAASSTSKRLESVTFFLDESLDSHSLVAALRQAGALVERATEHFPRGTPDATWLSEAGRRQWVVLTRDKRIRYRALERLALQNAGVRAFVFTGGNVSGAETSEILVAALRRIITIAHSVPAPFVYHFGKNARPQRME
jgi:hypothetical protein